MTLATNITSALQRVGQEFKSVRSALSIYQPVAATRKSYWSLGGCTATSTNFTSTKGTAERTRFQLTVQPTRFRVHVRNYSGLGDYAPANPITVTGAYIGQQSLTPGTPWDYASTPQSLGGNIGTAVAGLTEYVSGWQTPTYDMVANKSLFSVGFTYASGGEIAYGNGSHSIVVDDASLAGSTATVPTPTGNASSTAWYTYYYTILEAWIEYEFQDDAARIGLAIGHSMVDGTQFTGASTPGWDGQMTGFPQIMARRNKHTMTVNAFATSKTTDWNSASSTKWTSRFTDLLPDYVILMITENDLMNTTNTAAVIDANMRTIINIIATRYPKASIYVCTPLPIKPMTNDATKDATRDTVSANITALMAGGYVRGIIDMSTPPASIRSVTTATGTGTPAAAAYTTSVLQDTYKASLLGADSQHLNPAGHSKLAEAADMSGSSVLAINPPRGQFNMTPAIGGYMGPQGVVSTGGQNLLTAGTLRLSPFIVGPLGTTVDAISYFVSTAYSATATTVQLGIYTSGPDGMPVMLNGPIGSTVTQSVNAAAVGTKTVNMAIPTYLVPGTYWIAIVVGGTTATAGAITSVNTSSYTVPPTGGNNIATSLPYNSYTGTSTGLPTTQIALTAANSVGPLVSLRRSA